MPWKEKRMRIRYNDAVDEGTVRINPKAADYLGLSDEIEIVIAGKKRLRFKVLKHDMVPENEVWCNPEELRTCGVADKTIATCRAPLKK